MKKILSTSTTGLVLLSSLANPLVTLATTEEKSAQETVSSSTENKQLTTETSDLLQKPMTSSENSQAPAENQTEQTEQTADSSE